jgi:hypothetical protein
VLAFVDYHRTDFWILGTAFMKGYYIIHDNDDHANARMGFAPHSGSTKSFVEEVQMPTIALEDIIWEINWIG